MEQTPGSGVCDCGSVYRAEVAVSFQWGGAKAMGYRR